MSHPGGYGQPDPMQQPNYGYGQPGYAGQPEHPQSQVVFILGIVGIFTGVILAAIAWYLGAQAKKEIDAGAPYAWEGTKLKTGYTLGKIFTIIHIVLGVVIVLIYVFLIMAAMTASFS